MLPEDIKSLVNLCIEYPENPAMLKALLALLEKANDSAIIIKAFEALPLAENYPDEIKEQASILLQQAGASGLAEKWSVKKNIATLSLGNRVVPLRPEHELVLSEEKKHTVKLDDIGGLHDVKVQIKRKIIKPFENPILFQRFKRRAGGGVLMYGPPGCGKTLLAKAVANECNARFIEARASEVLDMYVGNAEKKITAIFKEAREKHPSVIFFDEVEALAQRRQYGASSTMNTVISTLLSEMDGLSKFDEGVLFLGATNVPWSIDPAFRRPGRFDRTIFVPPPDKIARSFILKQILKQRPIADNLEIDRIANLSSGFSGADLDALVETAVDFAIEASEFSEELISINNEHFAEAFKEVKPSTGEWLAQARSYAEYANQDGLYDDLKDFIKKYA